LGPEKLEGGVVVVEKEWNAEPSCVMNWMMNGTRRIQTHTCAGPVREGKS